MEKDKTILELLDKLEKEELDFLPDENAKKAFMALIKFMIVAI
ncbi:hypothetical protein [Clostridium thailandense]|nr:hypothetical protein [Clostridium thailandense]